MRSEDDFKKWLRRIALGVTAAPLAFSSVACGRTESDEFSVIPNAKVVRTQNRDAGVDAGIPDAGMPDAGSRFIIYGCNGYATSSNGQTVTFDGGGLEDPQFCSLNCPLLGGPTEFCQHVDPNDRICWYMFCGVGRLTDGVQPHACADNALGSELSNMAAHEAAAALAFAQLSRELDRHGVHQKLTRRARRAAREEVRHARLVGALASRHGGSFGVTPARDSQRSLEALAIENASEGCVRETLGALIGLHQARHASDAQVRAVMASVSADELGHSAWSHALAESLETRLSLPARRRVREAREVALANAERDLSVEPSASLRGVLGLPDATRVQSLARSLRS
ncbi:MAG: ferritin-like domain-containing protein [Archangium sp.]